MPRRNEPEERLLPMPATLGKEMEHAQTPNLSLKYYKYASVYKNGFQDTVKNKKSFLDGFIGYSSKPEYREAFGLRRKYLEKIGDGFSLTTATRLLFGIGYQHPLEIGFMFDWTTGLPIIPGSSLKGIARDYARNNKDHWDEELVKRIFGPDNNDNKRSVGAIIFLSAFPCPEKVQALFEIDVMTPHYTRYYGNPTENPPADWYDPVPIPFLTVPAGVRYCFRIADRTNLGRKETGSQLLKDAKNILRSALLEHGVGAKTAVDYGYFR